MGKSKRRLSLAIVIGVAVFHVHAAAIAHAEQISFSRASDLDGWQCEYEKWMIDKGVLTQSPVISSGMGSTIWRPGIAYGDFELTIEFRHTERPDLPAALAYLGGFGVIYRAQSATDYHRVTLDFQTPQKKVARIERVGGGKNSVRVVGDVDLKAGQWQTLRIVAHGPKHEIYLDGKLIATKTDAALTSGAIALQVDRVTVQFRNLRIKGNPVVLKSPLAIPTLPYVTVAGDAGKGGYEGFPTLVRSRKSGDLLCAFYAGFKHVPSGPNEQLPKGGAIAMVRSKDNGKTWSEPEIIYDSPMDDHDPGMTQLSDGRLAITICCWPCEGTHKPFVIWSEDDGKTWSDAKRIDSVMPFAGTEGAFRGKIVELDDGSLLLGTQGKVYPQDPFFSAVVRRSTDGGKTWPWTEKSVLRSPVKEGHDANVWEPCLVKVPDGRILMVCRQKMWWSESTDQGQTWSELTAMAYRGDQPTLFLTSKNILLIGMRCKGNPRGSGFIYSKDFGRTWSEAVLMAPVIGANVDFAELPDGRIFAVYYTEGNSNSDGIGSDVRGVFLRTTQSGDVVVDAETGG